MQALDERLKKLSDDFKKEMDKMAIKESTGTVLTGGAAVAALVASMDKHTNQITDIIKDVDAVTATVDRFADWFDGSYDPNYPTDSLAGL